MTQPQTPTRPVDIGKLITRDPKLRGGRPCIAGTGVSVQRIVGWYQLGWSPEEITENYGHLSLAQVYAALTYYHANRAEIDSFLADEARLAAEMETTHHPKSEITL